MKAVTTCLLGALALFGAAAASLAQSPKDTRLQLNALRSNDVPHDCERAVEWLMKYREALKKPLLDELGHTSDPQARDAILHVLFNTASFSPDDNFCRFVMARLPEQDTVVPNSTFLYRGEKDPNNENNQRDNAVHWEAWEFINAHFDAFEPLLKEQIGTAKDPWLLWAIAWLLEKRGLIEQYAPLFTSDVLRNAAANLKNDTVHYNASQAVRLLLILGKHSLPVLQEAAKSSDAQTRDFAHATIDALGHDRRAVGFLNARVNLTKVLFGPPTKEPTWLSSATRPFADNPEQGYSTR